MQYDADTPADYLKQLDDDWRRETLMQLRALLMEKAPHLTEAIAYKMLSYSDDAGTLFHLNAQKRHVGFYTGDAAKVDTDGSLLAGLDVGKGCIRFKKSNKVADTSIGTFIERALAQRQTGELSGC